MIGILGTVIKFALRPALRLANKAPKGSLTGIGGVIAAAGAVFGVTSSALVTSENLVPMLNAIATIITAIGGVVAAFGAQRAHSA